jgi:hypothetical protein
MMKMMNAALEGILQGCAVIVLGIEILSLMLF